MTAPASIGTQTPYAGYTFGDLYESLLSSFSLTNSAFSGTDASMTPASAVEIACAKRYVKDALVYLQAVRQQEWALSRVDLTAVSDYSGVALPSDFGTLESASIGNRPLTPIRSEEYEANRVGDDVGGGSHLWQEGGDASHCLVVVQSQATDATAYSMALEVYPAQSAAWTVRVVYRASAKALSGDTDAVRMPVLFHPMLLLHARASWLAYRKGDVKGAMEQMALLETHMSNIQNIPSADGAAPRLRAGLPRDRRLRA